MKINLDSIEEAVRPIELFNQGCKTDATRELYTIILRKIVNEYLEDILKSNGYEARVNELVSKAKDDPKWIMKVLLTIVQELKKKTELPKNHQNHIEPKTITNYTGAVKKLFDMNDIALVWSKVYSMLPEMTFNDSSRGYARKEIQKMLTFADASERVAILIASSSGIRVGAFDFQWCDIKPVYLYENRYVWEDDKVTESVTKDGKIVCGIILVYKGSTASQFAFVTPETWEAVEDYRSHWIRETGSEPKDSHPFFKRAGIIIKPISEDGLGTRIRRLVDGAGIRNVMIKGEKRHNIPLMNGFRRYFNKTNKESLSKDSMLGQLIKKEMMMGHNGLIHLDRNYFKVHVSELIEEYIYSVPNLTISDIIRKQAVIDKQQLTISSLEQKDKKIDDLEKQLEQVQRGLEAVQKSKDISI